MLDKCHFIGIGGIGMSGLARLMAGRNSVVTGSDMASNYVTESLSRAGITVYQEHSASHISSEMTVVYSTDIKVDNPEYEAAKNLKCLMLHRSELLQKLMDSYCSLAVAGTHGKTTTSSLLTWVLEKGGFSPSYAIGGFIPQLNSNAGHGSGPYFVAEACESDGTFLNYTPFGGIITNIDFDHMDHYKTQTTLIEAFRTFAQKMISSNHCFWCGENAHLSAIQPPGISYGFEGPYQLNGSNLRQRGWGISFDVEFEGKNYSKVEVALIGRHNALNSLAVFGLALKLGVEEVDIREALRSFGGVLRRCEKKGEINNILFLDDYAHHPTELKTTLQGIRNAIGERRLIAIYQPHRYSRAKDCLGSYGGVFEDVDELFVTEIYASREKPIPGVSQEAIIQEIQQQLSTRCHPIQRRDVGDILSTFVRPHDVVVTLGAGDITKGSLEILEQLQHKGVNKWKVGVIFGGVSVEHEISLLSVEHILASLRPHFYEVEKFAIARDGTWITGVDAKEQLKSWKGDAGRLKISNEVMRSLESCDILFPVLHGVNGEDGTVQGFFELLSKAYVGCNCHSASVSMDKVATKRIALEQGIATLPFISLSKSQWKQERASVIAQVRQQMNYPVFVKPAHLGSSVGVHKVSDESSLAETIDSAFRFDTLLLIEQGVVGAREIEFAVFGNDEVEVFPPGEICADGQVYDYALKYGPNAVKTDSVAALSDELIQKGCDLVRRAYQAVGCVGMARIDTFLDREERFWLNEINPIPGFTKTSLYPQICAANGLSSEDLVDRLIILGLERRRQYDRLLSCPD